MVMENDPEAEKGSERWQWMEKEDKEEKEK